MTSLQRKQIMRNTFVTILLAGVAIGTLCVGMATATEPERERAVPNETALWEAAGEAYAAGTDKSAAMQQYRLFVQSYKGSEKSSQAQFMLAECYFAVDDYERALNEYERVKSYKGVDDFLRASVLLRTGECHYNMGDFEVAIDTYNRLIKKYDDTFLLAEGLYEIGLAYIVDGNWYKLRQVYTELLERRPGYKELPQVKFALGLFAYQEKRYEEAVGYFERVDSDRGLYYLGRCLEDTGQYILAIQRYKQVLRQHPESPLADDVAFSIAEAFYRSGQNTVAVRSYRSFIESYPESSFVPNARYKMACVTFRESRYDESIRQLEEIVLLFPEEMICAYAQYLIGDCYMLLDRSAEAIFAYTDVIKRFGESQAASAALHKIVYAYTQEGNYGQAIIMAHEFYDRFSGDPLAPRVRVLQGYSHFQLDEYRAAIMAFQNVVDKHVNTDVAERALFLSTLAYFQTGELDRVLTNYNYIASKLLPTPSYWRARTYYYLGEAYYAQGLYRQSTGMYRLVLTGYPRSNVAAASLQGLVASLSQTGQYELALEEQEKFLLALANADSEQGTNSLAVGSIYFNQRKYEDALREFSDFLVKHSDDPAAASALNNQGDCYYRLQYYEQALEAWQSLLTRFPDSPEAQTGLYRIADTQFGLARFDAAQRTYRRLQAQYPSGKYAADAMFGIANCAYNLKNDDGAIVAFSQFIEQHPDDARVEDAELGIQSCYYRGGKDMEDYLEKFPHSALAADVYWNKGQDAFAQERYAEAAKAFEKVTLDYPESESGPGALFYLAESYYRQDALELSLAGYRNFTTTHPQHDLAELAQLRAATVLFKMENFEDAAHEYEVLTDLFPEGEYVPLAAYNAAICYQEIEDWHAAIGGFSRFMADHPNHENANGLWLQIANIYQEELGDYVNAADAYSHALESTETGAAEIGFRQGECLEKAGDIDGALDRYRFAATGGPTDPFRIAALAQIGQLSEDRGDWGAAVDAYQRIIDSGGNPEWTQMAQDRITAIREAGVTSE